MDQKFKISKNLKNELNRNQGNASKTKSQTPAEFNFTFNQKMNPQVEKQNSQKSNKQVEKETIEPKTATLGTADKMEKIQLFSPNNVQRV